VILSHTAVSSRSVTTGSRASTTTVKHVGRNHVWIPSLGISRSVRPGPPSKSRAWRSRRAWDRPVRTGWWCGSSRRT